MRIHALFLSLLLAGSLAQVPLAAQSLPNPQPSSRTQAEERALLHQSVDWQLIAPHLADPATATEAQLEMTGDVLLARRFPEDALDYYTYAMKRGGPPVTLLKKMGVVRLELRQPELARALFQQCVHLAKKDPQAWNNLGAADYVMGSNHAAIREYKRAVKLDKRSAVFHANLGIAYFAQNDGESARTKLPPPCDWTRALWRQRATVAAQPCMFCRPSTMIGCASRWRRCTPARATCWRQNYGCKRPQNMAWTFARR